MGIPNVRLINALLRRCAVNVGDEPADTKTSRRYDLSPQMYLVDTPGLMWLALLQDYRDGMLGRISLETPATRAAMLGQYQSVLAKDADS